MTAAAPRHISVLGREAVEMLDPRDGGIYVDATFGAGGYSRAIPATPGRGSSASTATVPQLPAASISSTVPAAG